MKYINGILIKLYNKIISSRIINRNVRLCRRVRSILFHNICYECLAYLGKENAGRSFYVIRCPQENMGLFAAINYVVYHIKVAVNRGLEPVIDWQHYPNKYFSTDDNVGKVNVWDLFFEQPTNILLDEVYRSQNVMLSSGEWDASAIGEAYDMGKLQESHEIYKRYIRLNTRLKELVKEESNRIGFSEKKILGVKIRGTDFITTRPSDHSKLPELYDVLELIDKKMSEWGPFDGLYLATEDKHIFQCMSDKYKNILFYTETNTYDLSDVGDKWLSEMYDGGQIDKIKDMEDYLITTYMLAETDYLIAPAVGGTIGALRIKGKYRELHIM